MHVIAVKTSARRIWTLAPAGELRSGATNGACSSGPFQLFMMSVQRRCSAQASCGAQVVSVGDVGWRMKRGHESRASAANLDVENRLPSRQAAGINSVWSSDEARGAPDCVPQYRRSLCMFRCSWSSKLTAVMRRRHKSMRCLCVRAHIVLRHLPRGDR